MFTLASIVGQDSINHALACANRVRDRKRQIIMVALVSAKQRSKVTRSIGSTRLVGALDELMRSM